MVLSVGMKMTSVWLIKLLAVSWISLVDEIPLITVSIPASLKYFLASSTWTSELRSLVVYIIPTFLVFGRTFFNNSTCLLIGDMSLVPVTFPPTLSIDLTNLAETGSVTAVKRIGLSFVKLLKDWAAGVAIANMTSLSSISDWEIVCKLDWSPCAFW